MPADVGVFILVELLLTATVVLPTTFSRTAGAAGEGILDSLQHYNMCKQHVVQWEIAEGRPVATAL